MTLETKAFGPYIPHKGAIALSLSIRPSHGLPGEFIFETDSAALLRMLNKKTELPSSTIDRFKGQLYSASSAQLCGVELSEGLLTEIGYFLD